MNKREHRVQYDLEPVNTKNKPSEYEIMIILRAADEIIASAGRSMLAKILKGSKDKKVIEYKLDKCPSYGYYSELTIDKITSIVDWTIINGYLEIEYQGRLPMIVFTEIGWELYKPFYAGELYKRVVSRDFSSEDDMIEQLKNTNRQVVHILLEKMGERKNIGLIRFLEKWEANEVKKVRKMISDAVSEIKK